MHTSHSKRLRINPRLKRPIIAIFLIIIAIFIINATISKNYGKSNISPTDVAAFRIPYNSTIKLYDLSEKYDVNFYELLSLYAIDNNFFPDSIDYSISTEELEKTYILNYDQMQKKYPEKQYSEYHRIVNDIFSSAKIFPIALEYDNDDFMYANSFGSKRYYGEKIESLGIEIIDRENIPGRMTAISITNGTVADSGWSSHEGYFIDIKSSNNIVFHYAGLTASNFEIGENITAGQTIGSIGSGAYAKKNSDASTYPTSLIIQISLDTTLTNGDFNFNPYPLLRFLEYKSSKEIQILTD